MPQSPLQKDAERHLQAAREGVRSDGWPVLEADAGAAIAALEAAAGSEVFPVAPVPLDTAVRADLDDSFRGVRYLEVVDRATALHELALDSHPLLANALRGAVGVRHVATSVAVASGSHADAHAYMANELARFRLVIARQLVTADHELAPPAAELLHAAELAADLEHLRADRSALLAARAEAERAAAIAASQPTVDRLRELPSRFMLPRRRGDDMRAEAGRVTAANLISEATGRPARRPPGRAGRPDRAR